MQPRPAVVFVVDDEASVRGYLMRLVQSVGLACQAYGSVDEFLEHVDERQCGCAILDVRLPGASGLDAQQFLADRGIPLPVIFVTGYADVGIAVRAMKAGAVDVFVKPINSQDLLDSINRAIGDRPAAARGTGAAPAARGVAQHAHTARTRGDGARRHGHPQQVRG